MLLLFIRFRVGLKDLLIVAEVGVAITGNLVYIFSVRTLILFQTLILC